MVTGINNTGDLVGEQVFRFTSPFAVFGGVLTSFAAPGNTSGGIQANGLNNHRQIVGSAAVYTPGQGSVTHGYVSSGSSYAFVDVPGAFSTDATGINDAGQIVGNFSVIGPLGQQGFLDNAGIFTTIDRPGAQSTSPIAVNNAGEVAGTYTDATGEHGFTEIGGVFNDITGPNGAAFLPVDLNNLGQLIGAFGGTSGPSYLATPQSTAVPEPAALPLLGGGLIALALIRRRRAVQG